MALSDIQITGHMSDDLIECIDLLEATLLRTDLSKEFLERLVEIVKRFLNSDELIVADSQGSTTGTNKLRVFLKPSERFSMICSAIRAGNIDFNIFR